MQRIDGLIFFVLLISIGYFFSKLNLLPAGSSDILPAILVNICYPALVLETFTQADINALTHTGLPVMAATFTVTFLLFLGSLLLYRKQPPSRKPLLCFITGIGNVSYVTIPLMRVFLSSECLFAAIIHGTVQDFLIWGLYHQLFLGAGAVSKRQLLRQVAASPCLIAVIVGALLAAFQITLPSFVQLTISQINAITSPVALLFLGALIYQHGLLAWRKDRSAVCFSLTKVILLPILVFCTLRFFLPVSTSLLLAILFGSPAPLMSVVWCKLYNGDTRLAVDCCICSTLVFLLAAVIALLIFTRIGLI